MQSRWSGSARLFNFLGESIHRSDRLAVPRRLKYACLVFVRLAILSLLSVSLSPGCASQALSVDDPSILEFEHRGLNVFPREGRPQTIDIVVKEGFHTDLDYGSSESFQIVDPDWSDLTLGQYSFASAFEITMEIIDDGNATEEGRRELTFVIENNLGQFTLTGEITYLP